MPSRAGQVRRIVRYRLSGPGPAFWFWCAPETFQVISQQLHAARAARFDFLRSTHRADFGGAVGAEMREAAAAADLTEALQAARLDTMQLVPGPLIRALLVARRADVDCRFLKRAKGSKISKVKRNRLRR